ncbi:stomatal closure-related actin-binding 2-like, partial [Olea europaea subsp. europaea]
MASSSSEPSKIEEFGGGRGEGESSKAAAFSPWTPINFYCIEARRKQRKKDVDVVKESGLLGDDSKNIEEIIVQQLSEIEQFSLNEVVVEGMNQLMEQRKRLSIHNMMSKYDKILSAATELSVEAKLRELPSLEGHVPLKKLRDALECLKGRLGT